jgi:hypothetical protein
MMALTCARVIPSSRLFVVDLGAAQADRNDSAKNIKTDFFIFNSSVCRKPPGFRPGGWEFVTID